MGQIDIKSYLTGYSEKNISGDIPTKAAKPESNRVKVWDKPKLRDILQRWG